MASSRHISEEAARPGPEGSLDDPTSLFNAFFDLQRAQWDALMS